MQSKKITLLLSLLLIVLSCNVAFAQAQGGPEGPPPPAFTGTVFALSFAFVLGLGGIILYGTSKREPETEKPRVTRHVSAKRNIVPSAQKAGSEKKNIRKRLIAGEIDEKTYLEEIQKLK